MTTAYVRHILRLNADVADTASKKVYDNFANIGGQTLMIEKFIFLKGINFKCKNLLF